MMNNTEIEEYVNEPNFGLIVIAVFAFVECLFVLATCIFK